MQKTSATSPGSGSFLDFPGSNKVVSRGDTLCPKCGRNTKAVWLETKPLQFDPFGPARYRRGGSFSSNLPSTITLKFKCSNVDCGHVHEGIVFSDSRFFHPSGKGVETTMSCGVSCACRASDGAVASPLGKNALGTNRQFTHVFDHFDKLSPCVTLIEIVRSCNWSCPTCLASSSHESSPSDYVSFDDFKIRIQAIIDRRDQDIEILQLSGGEPTLHPQFFEILKWSQEHPRIHVVMINTNGTKLLIDSFGKRLTDMVDRAKVHLYLKFNGPTEEAQMSLAGFNAHQNELRALQFVGVSSIPTTLAMTVIPSNLRDVWYVAAHGLVVGSVRGVNYQPRFGAGRIEAAIGQLVDAGHVINHLIDQAPDILSENSIWPLPCGDPNCQFIGMLHRETMACIGSATDEESRIKLLGFLANKVNYGAQDLTKCGCETTEFGKFVGQLESTGQMFRLSIKPFMTFGGSVHNWSCNRTDQCCTSVVGHDGKLHSFCRLYNGRDGQDLLWPKKGE